MFFGFNSAVRGLLASQRALYTTNHNIDNANTKGYSRQQIEQRATNPYKLPGIGFLGTGTEIYNVERVRDSFVDFKYWNERAPLGEWEIKTNSLTEIEKLIGEPSKSSFSQYMNDFYKSLDEMSKNPSDISFREPVKENALAFTKHINETTKRLMNMKEETLYQIDTKVKQVNGLVDRIGALNKQIYTLETDGKKSNDLRDRRELLVDELSKIVNINVTESSDGKYDVSLGGISLVDHIHTNKLSLKTIQTDQGREIKINWENGSEVEFKSGELKGLLDLLTGDGQNNSYRGIPYFENHLNQFAKGFADKFNELHEKGYTFKGENIDSKTGIKFFTYDEKNPGTTITVSDEVLEDIRNIAAAGNKDGSAEDNINLLALIEQREDKEFFKDGVSRGTPDDYIKSMISSLAVDNLQAKRFYTTQSLMQQNIGLKRESISGVNLNDEMGDMIRFQHVYVASSKMISTMDMLLDITVNRLGMVGR